MHHCHRESFYNLQLISSSLNWNVCVRPVKKRIDSWTFTPSVMAVSICHGLTSSWALLQVGATHRTLKGVHEGTIEIKRESLDLQRTSRYSGWLSWPMELLAVQMYWPAYVNWTFFKERDDTRAWLRTTIFLSRLCSKDKKATGQYLGTLRLRFIGLRFRLHVTTRKRK